MIVGLAAFLLSVWALPEDPSAPPPSEPESTYWVYVGAESGDTVHRIRFGPDGARVEETIHMASLYGQSSVPELFTEGEAPHGLGTAPDGAHLYMTTGHGLPDGKLWKIETGTGRLLADPVDLGRFPASLGVSPDGLYVFVVNFNLHGEMIPSTVSVVYAPDMVEVAQVETCTMPHGSRVHPSGRYHYSVCMMDDQLVEIDTRTLTVSRRFGLAAGSEALLDPNDRGPHAAPAPGAGHDHDHGQHAAPADAFHVSCSPTWVQPSPDGKLLYVPCNASDEVLEISLDEGAVVRRLPTGRGPYNVEVTRDGRLIATLKQGHGVEIIDLREEQPDGVRLDTSTSVVHGVAISHDDRYAFVSVEGVGGEPGKVDIFDLRSHDRVASVPVGLQASGITFWKMESPER